MEDTRIKRGWAKRTNYIFVRVDPATLQWVDEQRGKKPRSQWVWRLLSGVRKGGGV